MNEASPGGPGLVNRVIGIIVSPRETFEQVVARPRWLGVLLLTTLTTTFLMTAFVSTKVGQDAWIEQSIRGQEQWGRKVGDKQMEMLEKMAPFAPLMVGIPMLIAAPIVNVVMSAILFGVFKVVTRSAAGFKQAFAVVVHAGVIGLVHMLTGVPLNYIRGAMSGSTSLAVFLPSEEPSFFTALAGAVDPFVIWWIVVLATGLAVLYKRRTAPIASVLLGIYGIVVVIIAAVVGLRGGA